MTAVPEPNASDPLIGKVAAERYHILEPIARGGMGRIYKAEQVGLGRMVALKVLDDRTIDPEGFRKRFMLEAATSAKLTHPNIVVVHDHGSFEIGGARRYFMAMELLDGPTLAGVLKEAGGRLPVGRACFITREIARALREAHRHGVVHRDLKPSNVMLVERGDGEHVKVLDFGIAKVLQREEDESEEQLTHEGVLVGTPRYTRRLGDHRADPPRLRDRAPQRLRLAVPLPGQRRSPHALRAAARPHLLPPDDALVLSADERAERPPRRERRGMLVR